ncbi:hypothetical protein HPC49_32365 [Pyxidicoccus fallax]|uniref:Lipoprotein n=1 Tax=Pyxidicoccus fallax TaxID=394095 RepID=A0A848LKE1_9BACT|nr:hypothetical protein [Pyxidicoccus fallax]NMO18176.1 hypothetical protein [Pyxidicoccus fallax]NPC82904.1 hypothetical protein [Pyxidicoccus fallax]
MRALGLAAAALLLAAGCIPETQLRPTTDAQRVQGGSDAARAEASGVTLVADGAAWKGTPENLERSLTPVLVRLENHSGRPLRLQYGDFALVGTESRFRYSAVPPLAINNGGLASASQGTGGSGRTSLYLGFGTGWGYGPYSSWSYWPRGPFVGPYYNPFYPDPYWYGQACQEPLPTADMLSQVLPEGTLGDGGRVGGFLYFQGVAARESRVVLQARLVDANTGEPMGTLDIPFQVSGR